MAESSVFSSAGAGLDLVDAPLEILGRRFLVAVHLHAEVRNAMPTKDGHLTNYEPTYKTESCTAGEVRASAAWMTSPTGAEVCSTTSGNPWSSPEISSRFRCAVSGSTKVRRYPATDEPPATSNMPRSPILFWSCGTRNTPMNAPSLP